MNPLDALPRFQRKRSHVLGVFARPRAARLSQRIPGCDPLHDDRAAEGEEGVSPRDLRQRVPSRHLGVPPQALVARRQPRRGSRPESLRLVLTAADIVRAGEVADVRQRMPDGGHLPVQDADDPRLRPVEDHVVDLVVAVHKRAPVARLRRLVGEEAHHVLEVRQLPDWFLGVDIHRLRLRLGDGGEGRDLPVVEPRRLAKTLHAHGLGVDSMELGQGPNCIPPSRYERY